MESWGELFESSKHFLWFQGVDSVAAKSNTSVHKPRHSNSTRNKVIYTMFSWHLGYKHSVNDAVSSGIWMSGLPDTWMTPQGKYGGILCFFLFFLSVSRSGHQLPLSSVSRSGNQLPLSSVSRSGNQLHLSSVSRSGNQLPLSSVSKSGNQLPQLYWLWLQHFLPLKMLKCFVDLNTSPTPP